MLLPAPFAPVSATISPARIANEAPSGASRSRPGWRMATPSTRQRRRSEVGHVGAMAAGGIGASISSNADRIAARPSSLAWKWSPSWRSGRYASGARMSTNNPVRRSRLPSTRRIPIPDRDERDRQGREELEREGRQEGDPERRHRLDPVVVRDPFERGDLGLGPPEDLEGREALDDVEEVVGQPRQRPPAAPPVALDRAADEDHEDHDQRHGQADGQRRHEVRAGDRDHDRDGNDQRRAGPAAGSARSRRRARRRRGSRGSRSRPSRVGSIVAARSWTPRSRIAARSRALTAAAARWALASWAQAVTARPISTSRQRRERRRAGRRGPRRRGRSS